MSTSRAGLPKRLFRRGEVVQILGISRRQLQYWADTDLVPPSTSTAGGHHRYAFPDLVALRAAKRLIDGGVSVQRIRRSIQALRQRLPDVRRPLAELVLVATGDVVLVLHRGAAFEAVSGQEWVFEVAQLERDVAAWEATPVRARRPLRPAPRPRRRRVGA
jgi:DNA-binding transcriptional MerR regulator